MLTAFAIGTVATTVMVHKSREEIRVVSDNVASIQKEIETLELVLKGYSGTTINLTEAVSNMDYKNRMGDRETKAKLDDLERKIAKLEGLKKIIAN